MNILPFLIGLPVAFGILVLLLPQGRFSRGLVGAGAIAQAGAALAFAFQNPTGGRRLLEFELPGQDYLIFGVEVLLAGYFIFASIRAKRLLPILLALVQIGLAIYGEDVVGKSEVGAAWVSDELAVMMVLIVGFVGGLIVIHSLGYMKRHHETHPEFRDRRRSFWAVVFIFLGAMYGVILANDLRLMLLFWEVTTWASFVLIGYNGDPVSKKNAFLALVLNLLGGLAFAAALLILATTTGRVGLSDLARIGATSGSTAGLATIPVALLAIAGLVKAAQLPFTPWLLGAMVAPTPVSALLHSSTMVKAGVFLLLRLAPAFQGRTTGYLVALVGILTFVICSFIAVSRRSAKRVLALSTVANLGLIAVCAGIGTPQLLWAAFFLVVFHAIAKALLFLGVGTASLALHSLDIEDMGGLVVTMPRLAILLVVGIAGMFVAPFGMLISKWTVMEAFIAMNTPIAPFMIACLAWGSATTVFFWMKWIGVLIRMPDPEAARGSLEAKTPFTEALPETALAILAVLSFGTFPLTSSLLVEPWLHASFGPTAFELTSTNVFTTLLMIAMTVFLPAILILVSRMRTSRLSSAYMSGRSSSAGLVFKGTAGIEKRVDLRAPYLARVFPESRMLPIGMALGILLLFALVGTALA
ncbi:MAG TPA: proton-conducting transporter membrane subunit [Rectinemataceae bacterium]|nr:proton-conducting transporter membrane subunit [Rectinemataceae bacterium]